MACHRCGGRKAHTAVTVSYVGPGPCVVELSDMRVLQCTACGYYLEIQVPEPQALDILIRCLHAERMTAVPQLTFEHGHWRVTGHKALD